MSVSSQKQAASEALAGPAPLAGGIRFAEKLVLLSQDESLIEALTSIVPPESLIIVADEAALANHLLSGQAGVAFIDAAAAQTVPGATAQLTQRLHQQLPDVVLVVAGDGAAQSELAALVGDGTIYRFVHQPASAQRVKLFVDAAWRKRDGSSGASGIFPALSLPNPEPMVPTLSESPAWRIAVGLGLVALAASWYLLHKPAAPTASVTQPPAATPMAAAPAMAQAPPPALDTVVVKPGKPAAMSRPNSAVDAGHLRVKNLAAQLAREQPRVDARLRAIEADGVQAEAAAVRTLALPLPPPVVVPPPAPAPTVAASPVTAISATFASPPGVFNPPSSTPPASEARDPLSVAAVILHRVYAVDPEFPDIARENDLSGYVDLEFTVHSDGTVTDVIVLKAQPVGVFEKSSVAAVGRWRYRPIQRDGIPVTEHARLRLNFGYK